MLRHRPLALALAAGFAAVATWAACGGKQTGSPGKDGGADAGSGGAGGGGAGGSGAYGGTGATGGSGGSAGSPGEAGAWGPAPVWKAIPGSATGCTYERMVNAAQVRMFKWEPCSWTAGCEQAAWDTDLFGQKATFGPDSTVVDDGAVVRVGLTMWREHNMAIVTSAEGMGLDAVRVTGGKFDCRIGATSIWKNRFAVHVADLPVDHFGGILGEIGNMAVPPVAFTIPDPAPAGATQGFALGDARWLWWWGPAGRLSTVSAQDGSGFQVFAQSGGSVIEYDHPTTTGQLFLAQEYQQRDGGHVQGFITYSDGVSPMKPYLVPPDPDDDYLFPAFANSYVGFMKGIHQNDANLFDSVEIWATPYSTDPAQLSPEKIGNFPFTSATDLAGGWGHLGTITKDPPEGSLGVACWTIATKSEKTYTLPSDHDPIPFLGVTRTHFWVGGRGQQGDDPYLMRFQVE